MEDSDGRRWAVKVAEINGRLIFQHGWSQFVEQHSIVVGEFLVFNYARKSNLLVQIFGISGCERRHFPRINRFVEEESVAQRLSRRKRSASCFLVGDGKNSKNSSSSCSALEREISRAIVPADSIRSDRQISAAANCSEISCVVVVSEDEGEEQNKKRKKKKMNAARVLRAARVRNKAASAMARPCRSSGRRNLIENLPKKNPASQLAIVIRHDEKEEEVIGKDRAVPARRRKISAAGILNSASVQIKLPPACESSAGNQRKQGRRRGSSESNCKENTRVTIEEKVARRARSCAQRKPVNSPSRAVKKRRKKFGPGSKDGKTVHLLDADGDRETTVN